MTAPVSQKSLNNAKGQMIDTIKKGYKTYLRFDVDGTVSRAQCDRIEHEVFLATKLAFKVDFEEFRYPLATLRELVAREL